MVRVKYTFIVKIFAFFFFAFFIIPAFLRLIGGPTSPKDHVEHDGNVYDIPGKIDRNKNQNDKPPSRIGTVNIFYFK